MKNLGWENPAEQGTAKSLRQHPHSKSGNYSAECGEHADMGRANIRAVATTSVDEQCDHMNGDVQGLFGQVG